MAPQKQKITAAVVPVTFLAFLGAVAGQISYAPSTSPPTGPPSLSPASPNPISYPPSQSPLSSNPPSYLANPTPGSISPTYPPNPSQPIHSPRPSPSRLVPPTHPPSANPHINPSPSPNPSSTTYATSTSPTPSPSSVPATYPPSASPTSSISSPPTFPPSTSPSPSISSPPIYSLDASLSLSVFNPPTYLPSASPGPSPSITSPPTVSPSPTPSSSISIPPTSPSPSPSPSPSNAPSEFSVGYYEYLCPEAEAIVREAVKSAIDSNRGIGTGLIRLFFHDCFVQGCDASVLLNTTGSSETTERESAPNQSLRGFEVIDAAKSALEVACPRVVSCADIVAFAGRDATFFLSGNAIDFNVSAGRYDGRVSLDSEALANLPPPFASLEEVKEMFAAKGLDAEDMVTLSGAHTVGRSRCSSFSDRLTPHVSDMNATLSGTLVSWCNSSGDTVVPQDSVTPDGLDSQYYRSVLNHEVLFASDAALLASNQTADMVFANAFTPGLWETKFMAAMVKMGCVGIKNSTNGEIRDKCWMVKVN